MKKSEFLNNLKTKLEKGHYSDTHSVIDYYDELIEDKKESGLKEEEIITNLGNIDDILKEIEIERRIDKAKEKPTLSNGIKALIGVLSILSIPLLIPIILLIATLGFTGIILLFSLIIVFGSIILSGIVLIGALIVSLFTNELPFITFLFSLGVIFVVGALSIELIRLIIDVTKKFIIWFMDFLKGKISKRKEIK